MPPTPTTLSSAQMQAMAQSFHDIATAISQVRLDSLSNGSSLDDPHIVQLQGLVFSLLDKSSSFALQSANITLNQADKAVAEISTATKAANKALDKLKNIDKAINIGSSVIILAVAISTRDLGQIASAAGNVITATGLTSNVANIATAKPSEPIA
jgi:hypothetical protein